MRNWDDYLQQCRHEQHWRDVERVCSLLNIPCRRLNFSKQYWHDVFEPFLDGYRRGFTPNPDIDCNAKIKFGCLLDSAVVADHDMLATGHYCIAEEGRLYRSVDPRKDQSYFLCKTSGDRLKRCLFPLGGLLKSDVRLLARRLGWHFLADKRESMGICFVENESGGSANGFSRFIRDFIGSDSDEDEGPVVDIGSGKVVARHCGLHSFTIGQRVRSLREVGKKMYVVEKDLAGKCILVSSDHRHPLLYPSRIRLHDIVWIAGEAYGRVNSVKIRHSDNIISAQFVDNENVKLNDDSYAPAPGQTVAFYDVSNAECLGGGTILSTHCN